MAPLLPRGEQLVAVLGRQRLGDVAHPGVVGGTRRRGEPEPRAGGDDQSAGGGDLRAHLRLPPLLDLALQATPEVPSEPPELARHVPFHGALGDPERLDCGLGALELLDQVLHLRLCALRDAAGERPLQRAVQAVPERIEHDLLLPFSGCRVGPDQVRDVEDAVRFLELLFGPQDGLGALVLHHPGRDAEPEAAGHRLALRGVRQDVQRGEAGRGVDDGAGADRDRV